MRNPNTVAGPERPSLRERLRVGVIGVGRFGENHVRAYAESSLSSLLAVADVDASRARSIAARYGVPRHYSDFRELLADPQIQAVSIATPAHLHVEAAMAAAALGKHILLEKPIATSLADAQAIVAAADRNGVKLMVGHLLRFEIHYASIFSAIAGGTLGRPVAVMSRMNNPISEARYAGAVVSPVLHVMIHHIDLSLWYMDRLPQRVFCMAAKGRAFEELKVPDGCVLMMDFAGGGLAVSESFWCLPEEFANWTTPREWAPLQSDIQMEVICTEGVIHLGGPVTSLRACDQGGWKFPQVTLRPTVGGQLGGALREEINHFLTCCLTGQEPLVTGREGMAALRVALAAEESLETGAAVMLRPG